MISKCKERNIKAIKIVPDRNCSKVTFTAPCNGIAVSSNFGVCLFELRKNCNLLRGRDDTQFKMCVWYQPRLKVGLVMIYYRFAWNRKIVAGPQRVISTMDI